MILFCLLFVVGVILLVIDIKVNGKLSNSYIKESMAQLFHDAGLTPFVLSVWALLTGSTKFKKENIIKVFSSFFLLTIGIIFVISSKESYLPMISSALIEIAALFIISRLFFLREDSELMVERLDKQLEQIQNSLPANLALSYFYSFILPLARGLNNNQLAVKLSVNNNEEYILTKNVMTIFIPRNLNENKLKNITLGKTGILKDYKSYRPLIAHFLQYHEQDEDKNNDKHENKDEDKGLKRAAGMYDIPTILDSIYEYSVKLTSDELNIYNIKKRNFRFPELFNRINKQE